MNGEGWKTYPDNTPSCGSYWVVINGGGPGGAKVEQGTWNCRKYLDWGLKNCGQYGWREWVDEYVTHFRPYFTPELPGDNEDEQQ